MLPITPRKRKQGPVQLPTPASQRTATPRQAAYQDPPSFDDIYHGLEGRTLSQLYAGPVEEAIQPQNGTTTIQINAVDAEYSSMRGGRLMFDRIRRLPGVRPLRCLCDTCEGEGSAIQFEDITPSPSPTRQVVRRRTPNVPEDVLATSLRKLQDLIGVSSGNRPSLTIVESMCIVWIIGVCHAAAGGCEPDNCVSLLVPGIGCPGCEHLSVAADVRRRTQRSPSIVITGSTEGARDVQREFDRMFQATTCGMNLVQVSGSEADASIPAMASPMVGVHGALPYDPRGPDERGQPVHIMAAHIGAQHTLRLTTNTARPLGGQMESPERVIVVVDVSRGVGAGWSSIVDVASNVPLLGDSVNRADVPVVVHGAATPAVLAIHDVQPAAMPAEAAKFVGLKGSQREGQRRTVVGFNVEEILAHGM